MFQIMSKGFTCIARDAPQNSRQTRQGPALPAVV